MCSPKKCEAFLNFVPLRLCGYSLFESEALKKNIKIIEHILL
jgi:hypothetical protein